MPYLTPGEIPVLTKCKRIRIPDHPLIWGAVNGAMLELTKHFNWENYGGISAVDMAEIMWPFVDEFLLDEHCEEGTPDEGECTEFTPDAPFIQYSPNDPFQTPTLTPPGYILPPFYNNPLFPLPGVLPTDAMVNFASLPITQSLPDLIATGLPRIRVNFEGTGQVELELVKIIQGGQVLITHDDNPLTSKIVDLSALDITGLETIFDIFNIVFQGSANSVEVVEIDFDTPGNHYIDITFLPLVNEDVILGFGGGLRRVSLCGQDIGGDEVMPQFQVIDDGCTLQWRPNPTSSWQTLSTELCGTDGTDGTDATIDVDNYRVVECQLEVNEAGGWADIPGAHFYPITGSCPAEIFYARSALPYLLGKQLSDNADLFRLGFTAAGDVELQSFQRKMLLRFGTANNEFINLGVDGVVAITRSLTLAGGTTYGRLTVQGHNSLMHVVRVDGRTGQTVPIIQVLSHNTHVQPPLRISISGIGIAQEFTNTGGVQLIDDLQFFDYGGGNNRVEVASFEVDRETPAVSQYHGEFTLHATDYLSKKTVLRGSTDGTNPTLGVLGAPGTARRTITGDLQGNNAFKDLLEILEDFGWISDNTTLGQAPNPVMSIEVGQDCIIRYELQDSTVEVSTDLSTLACLQPEQEIDMTRCNVANGAMAFLIEQMYAQSVISYTEWYPIDVSTILEERLVFQHGDIEAFSTWSTDMSAQFSSNEADALQHFNNINDVLDEIKQHYFCALSEDGTLTQLGLEAFASNVAGIVTVDAWDITLFSTWLSQFELAAYAQFGAFGEHYVVADPCLLDLQNCAGLWCRQYQFNSDDYFPRWKIRDVGGQDHGEYEVAVGYQDWTEPSGLSYLKVGMVFVSDAEITSISFSWNVSNNPVNGGGIDVALRDWTTGALIDSWTFPNASNGNYTRTHAEATPFSPDGFYIDIQAAQETTITLTDATVNGQINVGGLLGDVC